MATTREENGRRLQGHRLFYFGGNPGELRNFTCMICNQRFSSHDQAHIIACQEDWTHLMGLPVGDNPLLAWARNPENPAFYLTYCGLRGSELRDRHASVPAQPYLDGAFVPNLCEDCEREALDPETAENWLGVR